MSRWPRPAAIIAAVAILVGSGYLFTALRDGPAPEPLLPLIPGESIPIDESGALSIAPPPDPAELDRLVNVFEDRIAVNFDGTTAQFLGSVYLRRAGLSQALDDYVRAQELLGRVVEMDSANLNAKAALAAASLGVHDFERARDLADEVATADTSRLDAIAVLGDALAAMGDLEGAADAFDRVDEASPAQPSILARQAALAYLGGDGAESLSLARQAESRASDGGAVGQTLAWYQAFAADLEFDLGNYSVAANGFDQAARTAPEFGTPVIGQAETAAAQGDIAAAISYMESIEDPGPGDFFLLGDLRAALDDKDGAAAAYAEGEALALTTSTDAYLRILVSHYADRGTNLDEAVAMAEKELTYRTDPFGWDSYAWALFRNGRVDDARKAMDEALAFGTPDAGIWYHAGLISAGLGENQRAMTELERALEISPEWHPLFSEDARRVLSSLEG